MSRAILLRIGVVLFFVGIFFVAKYFGVDHYLSLEGAQEVLSSLNGLVAEYFILASFLFIFSYIILAGFSLPGALVFTLLSGALFGALFGTILVNIGATIGATFAFLASRFVFGSSMQEKYATQLKSFNNEVDSNGAHYLLTLRFIPLFPFFLINILAGLSKVKVRTFVWTTSLGIIPGSFVYALVGEQLATLKDLGDLVSPGIITAFVLLGVFSLAPVVWKKTCTAKSTENKEQIEALSPDSESKQ